MKKINYRLVVLIILLLIVSFSYFTMKIPTTDHEAFTRLNIKYSGENQDSESRGKRYLQSGTNFYANSAFASFFEDVPCKESYFIYNFFSELKNTGVVSSSAMDSSLSTLRW